MTDSTPVRRYIAMVHTLTDGDGLIPLADAEPVGVVLASDFDRLQAERDSLRAEVERLKELNVGLTNQCNTFNRDGARLERELTARDVRITELCQKVDSQCSVESVLALVAERDSLRAQLAAALAKVEEAERDAERYRWLRVDSPGSRVVAEQMEDLVETDLDAAIDAAMPAKEGG